MFWFGMAIGFAPSLLMALAFDWQRERHARIVESYARGCITKPLTARIAAEIRGAPLLSPEAPKE